MIGDEIFQYGEKIEWIGHIKSVPRTIFRQCFLEPYLTCHPFLQQNCCHMAEVAFARLLLC